MIDVVLPALNEAGAIARLCTLMPSGYRAIVVDNGSTDGTAEIAAAAGATVVHEDVRGFGAACFAGLMAASAEIVCFMDADGSLDPRELPLVTEPIMGGTARLMMGWRQPDKGAWPISARLMNRALAVELRRRTHAPLHDLGPMRAARRQDLIDLGIRDRRFGWPLEMVLRAANEGWTIGEVPVRYAARIGKSKVTGTVRGTVRTIRDMSRVLAA
ncbi:MAG: glycosyl transferase family 2 [Ilumatobacteraceae bacterium]|nr:glycosyl transferase family 2 [Ilumatobacteraceae bacterium]